MRKAPFRTVFMGVESPDLGRCADAQEPEPQPAAADHRTPAQPYGMEVVGGIIMGLDSDDEQTGDRILRVRRGLADPDAHHQPAARPAAYAAAGTGSAPRRIVGGDLSERESNVDFLLPYDDVVESWRRTVTSAFAPEAVYRRFAHQREHTYPNRLPNSSKRRPTRAELRRGLKVMARTFWRIGVRGHYRRVFWSAAVPLIRSGRVEKLIHMATVSHHLITFANEVAAGEAEKCFYNPRPVKRPRSPPSPAARTWPAASDPAGRRLLPGSRHHRQLSGSTKAAPSRGGGRFGVPAASGGAAQRVQ